MLNIVELLNEGTVLCCQVSNFTDDKFQLL